MATFGSPAFHRINRRFAWTLRDSPSPLLLPGIPEVYEEIQNHRGVVLNNMRKLAIGGTAQTSCDDVHMSCDHLDNHLISSHDHAAIITFSSKWHDSKTLSARFELYCYIIANWSPTCWDKLQEYWAFATFQFSQAKISPPSGSIELCNLRKCVLAGGPTANCKQTNNQTGIAKV